MRRNTHYLLCFVVLVFLSFWATKAPAQSIASGCPGGTWNTLNDCQWLQIPVTIPPVRRLPKDGDVATVPAIQGTYTLDVNSPNLSGLFIAAAPGTNGTFSQPGLTLRSGSEGIGPFGSFSQTGGANIIGGTLTLTARYDLQGANTSLSSNDETINQVTLAVNPKQVSAGLFNQNGGKNTVSDTLTLGSFALATNGLYNLSGGQLSAANEIVGAAGKGTFNQTGGTNTLSKVLTLGDDAGGNGTYNLSAGTITITRSAVTAFSGTIVGLNGSGVFNQSGGDISQWTLSLAPNSGADGFYNQTGGTINLKGALLVADGSCAFNPICGAGSATYSLSGAATLSAAQGEGIGDYGRGTFIQNGGTNTMSGGLALAAHAGSGAIMYEHLKA